MPRLIDLSGKTFGYLEVLHRDNSVNKNEAFWICRCKCGSLCSVRGSYLRNGTTKSCGCYQKERSSECCRKDYLGKTFGYLTVIEYMGIKNRHTLWKCRCKCGNLTFITSNNLRENGTQSCGCIKSKGEQKIRNILQNLNIKYFSEYSFPDLRADKPLRFDIFIPDKNIAIEYQGIQHYSSVDFFGGEESLIEQQKKDLMKQEYCQKNSIKLIIIKYEDFPLLDEEYLLKRINSAPYLQSLAAE